MTPAQFLQPIASQYKARIFNTAITAAYNSTGVGGRNKNTYRLGCVIIRGKRILAVKNNSYKTHPFLLKFSQFPHLHAEAAAIIGAGLDNCDGADLYVVRITRNNQIALAKPCSNLCRPLIEEVGIRQIFFTYTGGFLCLR